MEEGVGEGGSAAKAAGVATGASDGKRSWRMVALGR